MKTTGVVRRIDELGRIVVPKEMRRTLRIREGDSIEIYSNNDSIVLKKYSLVESVDSFIEQYVEAVHFSSKKELIVVDTEKIIAVSNGIKRGFVGKKIDIKIEDMIQKRTTQIFERGQNVDICEGLSLSCAVIIRPITVYGDLIGAVIVLGDNYITDVEKMLAELSSLFVGKYLES